MGSLLAWLRSHPKITISVSVGPLLWGVHALLGWSAERDWRQYCKAARARGVILTFAELEQGDIPEAQNFAALPMFRQALAGAGGGGTTLFDLPRTSSGAQLPREDRIKRQAIDWIAWQKLFKETGLIPEISEDPIADVLRGLDRYPAPIAEWREGQERPYCRFRSASADEFARVATLRHLLQGAASFFGLRMRAHLARGESAAALADFHDAFQSYRALRDEPMLINGLIRLTIVSGTCMAVGNGLAAHAWKDPELQALEGSLASVCVGDDYRFAVSSERLFLNAYIDELISCGPVERSEKMQASSAPLFANRLRSLSVSVRTLRKNQLRSNQYLDVLAARGTADGLTIVPSGSMPPAPDETPSFLELWHYGIFHYSAAAFPRYEANALRIAAIIAQTRMAIALERHRLARGSFPVTLGELVPEFLPTSLLDPWTGQPMIYRLAPPDSFLLYAVGKNHVDDGGLIDRQRSASEQRDAVWLYAPP